MTAANFRHDFSCPAFGQAAMVACACGGAAPHRDPTNYGGAPTLLPPDAYHERRGPRVVPYTLTIEQTRDARAVTDAWNADRKTRGLEPLSLSETIACILATMKGLVAP